MQLGSLDSYAIAKETRFSSIAYPATRLGQMETLRLFCKAAEEMKCQWIVWLENDWMSVLPLPPPGFLELTEDFGVDTIRLFGIRKMKGDGPRSMAGEHRMGTKDKIAWQASETFPGWEAGRAHWGCGGTMIRASVLKPLLHLPGLKEIMLQETKLLTLRPKENIMWHIGEETTRDFLP